MGNKNSMIKTIQGAFGVCGSDSAGAIGRVSIMNGLLAAVALLKDILLASYFGTTKDSDAFLLAFFITDMVGCNLIANAVNTGCVPVFARLSIREGNKGILRGLRVIDLFLLCLTAITTACLFGMREPLISVLGSGYADDVKVMTVELFALLLPTVILYPAVYAGMAALQVQGRFGLSSFVPVLFNTIFLAGIIACMAAGIPPESGVYLICISLLTALTVMLLWTILFLAKKVSPEGKEEAEAASDLKETVIAFTKLFGPYLLMLFLTQGVLYFERYLAAGYGVGGVSALNYAYRVSQFPIWVFTAAIGTVAFPAMSRHNSTQNQAESLATLKKAIWLMLVFTIPVTIFLFMLRVPVLSILFQRQAFDLHSLELTAAILTTYCFAIIGQSVTFLCLKYFLSAGRTKEPTLILLITVVLNVSVDLLLFPQIGLAAFGCGAAAASSLNAVLLVLRISFDKRRILEQSFDKIKALFLSAALTAVIAFIYHILWNGGLETSGLLLKLFSIGAAGGLCALASFLSYHVKKESLLDFEKRPLHILTIDLEEWYHASLIKEVLQKKGEEPEERILYTAGRLLELLQEAGAKATFFVLGDIAEKYPDLIRRIWRDGHEIATHGYAHDLIYRQSPEVFKEDISKAAAIIEEIIGEKVKGYRAPSWSVTKDSLWALRILDEEGFLYDSSIFPIRTFLYGIPASPRFLHYPLSEAEHKGLAEIPPSTLRLFGKNFAFSGGFFFRALPYFAITLCMDLVGRQGRPVIVYLHPHEIDNDEPRMKLNLRDRLITYYGLPRSEKKLRKLLKKYQFTSIIDYYKF